MEATVVRWMLFAVICLSLSSMTEQVNSCKDGSVKTIFVDFKPQKGYCTWKGQCAVNPATGGMFNCYYNGPAINVSEDHDLLKLVNETCPWYVKGKNGIDTKVCCAADQIKDLKDQTSVARSLFSRCPACYRNFMKHFCTTTCDPDMSLHVDPMNYMRNVSYVHECTLENETKVRYLEEVGVYLTQNYGDRLYNSCSEVEYPEQSGKVVTLMCGGNQHCNSTLWLNFLGDPNLNYEQSPFKMNYVFTDSPAHPNMSSYNLSLTACDDVDSNYTCSCTDCPSPKLCPPLPKEGNGFPVWLVFTGISVAGILLSLFISTCCMVIAVVHHIKYSYKPIEEEEANSTSSSDASINADIPSNDDDIVENCGVCLGIAQVGAWMEFVIKSLFYYWGVFAAKYWFIVIPVSILLFGALCSGIKFINITTDPVELWSAPESEARTEKNYFDKNFSPFYRTEQIIIRTKPHVHGYSFIAPGTIPPLNMTFGPVFQREILFEVFRLQERLMKIKVLRPGSDYITLEDICFKPLAPDNNNCTIESVINYFQNDFDRLKYTEDNGFDTTYNASYHIHYCTRNPTAIKGKYARNDTWKIPCLAEYGGPVDPNTALGGFKSDGVYNNYDTATALLITFIINNHVDDNENKDAELWEKEFLHILKGYKSDNLIISYTAERAIVDEINRESHTDIITIAASYVCMFIYIALFLGKIRSVKTILIDLKVCLGFFGVLIVLMAVGASLGFISFLKVEASLIILEVVPFLVLAVGVDNLFILVHSYERVQRSAPTLSVNQLTGRALAEVAPSLLLTASSESAAFLLGAISTMPAVRTFSLCAGIAVFFNFILQVSAFVSVMALDAKRQRANRVDFFLWCVQLPKDILPRTKERIGLLHLVMKRVVSVVVLNRFARPLWMLLFGVTFFSSFAGIPWIQIGLDQRLALPKDSYLQDYFADMNEYLHIGAPVYFVIKNGFNYTSQEKQNLICSGSTCNPSSMGTQLAIAARTSNITRIAEPPSIWLDSYYEWLDPTGSCCGHIKGDPNTPCDNPGKENCVHCLPNGQLRPNTTEFLLFLEHFFTANPTTSCAAAGHAAYNSAVVVDYNSDFMKTKIETSYVMTFHTILKDSSDFISGLKQARQISHNLTKTLGVEVFPYSVFYVYYEQYLHIIPDIALNIGVSLVAVFLVSIAMLGLNVWGAFIVIMIIVMILVHMGGVMALGGINANAVSLVNLVMTVGIAVEFSAHIVRWFIFCKKKTRLERAESALTNMGSSVISGITITKFIGVFILAFAKSQLFEVYYFRMYIAMVFIGAAHGLIFLPVILSYIGPPYYPIRIRSPYPIDPSETVVNPPPAPYSSEIPKDERKYPDATIPKTRESLYPDLPTDVTNYVPYSNPGDYGPPTYPHEQQPTERTPLL